MKKEFLLIAVLAIIIIVLSAFLFWPKSSTPGLTITFPKANQEVSSPIKIAGTVSGNGWTGFEGLVGRVKLLDYKGNVLAETSLVATTSWQNPRVNFEVNLGYVAPAAGPATLVFANENPSGDPVRDKTFSLPIKIKATETIKAETSSVKVYFGKNEVTGSTCSVVFPVERVIPKTQAVAKAALEELLKGPTQAEKDAGYFSSIPEGSKLNSIKIENGTAYADFDQQTQSGGGSCSMSERVSEIKFTLKQFDTIKKVLLSVDGKTADIFQP